MDNNKKVFIIAEAGVNHNGDLNLAKKMIDAAALSGADAVKFQTFKTEELVAIDAEKAAYQKATTAASESQFQMLKKLELDQKSHRELILHASKKGILFLSTPFDLQSAQDLFDLHLDRFKIPSGELTNLPLVRKLAAFKKPIILSTGMASLEEIDQVVFEIRKINSQVDLTILHCNTEYPTPYDQVHLNAMKELGKRYSCSYGYSDHTLGIQVPIAATALGATLIEKHFTLDKELPGPDHQASLDPTELKAMVDAIRIVESAMGSFEKKVTPSEQKNIFPARKSIVYARHLEPGSIISPNDLNTKRPESGISPLRIDEFIGKQLKIKVEEGTLLSPSDFENKTI